MNSKSIKENPVKMPDNVQLGTNEIHCNSCDSKVKFVMPIDVKEFCKQIEIFNNTHRDCEEILLSETTVRHPGL